MNTVVTYSIVQNKYLKLVSHLLEIVTLLHIVNNSTIEIYSRFVLPSWISLSHVLNWVEK